MQRPSNEQYTYSPNNNTNENIAIYLRGGANNYMDNSYINQDNSLNLLPMNSEKHTGYQIPNNMNSQYDFRGSSYINNTNNENILDTTNEQNNIHNEEDINQENNIIENEIEEKKEKQNIIAPEAELFEDDDKSAKKDGEGEDLSELSEESNHEKEYNNNLLAQYEKVKRVKNKWKVSLKGCIVQKDQMEYVCGKVHGELEREW